MMALEAIKKSLYFISVELQKCGIWDAQAADSSILITSGR